MIEKLNKLIRLPEVIPCDKRMHYLVGAVIASLLLMFKIKLLNVFIIVFVIAFAIEFYQKATKSGQYDVIDAIAVIAGGLTVMLPFLV